jgi:hypothetical protein
MRRIDRLVAGCPTIVSQSRPDFAAIKTGLVASSAAMNHFRTAISSLKTSGKLRQIPELREKQS